MQIADRDVHWMTHALALARTAQAAGEVPVGAVLVAGDVVLGEGWNCPIGACDPSAHAEIQALRAAGHAQGNYRLPGTTLYVTIEPCAMCVGAMAHARIERLVFGAAETKGGAVISRARLLDEGWFNHRMQWTGGVLEAQCSELIRGFFRHKRGLD